MLLPLCLHVAVEKKQKYPMPLLKPKNTKLLVPHQHQILKIINLARSAYPAL